MDKKDEEYLDEKFPKGETKFRGEAMVLIALAREEGKLQTIQKVLEMIDTEIIWYKKSEGSAIAIVKVLEDLKSKISGGKGK